MPNEEKLIKVYQQAQQHLINLIAYKEARGNVTWYQETLLKQVRIILAQLNAYSDGWVLDAINEAYNVGALGATESLALVGVTVSSPETFARLHTAAIENIVSNTAGQLRSGTAFVGRRIEDAIRQAGLDAIAQKLSTGSTVREAARLVKQNLLTNGIKAIRDKRGHYISLDAYAETVARSTTREATNTATMNQLTYNGYDLVKMSSHATTCAVCAVYQGRVYSISGLNTSYPHLSIAFSGGYANIHPRCRHVVVPYIPALADDPEGDKSFSNRPFDIDTRSKVAVDRYNNDQADKRKLRTDRQQWERYRIALGADAPKTLSGFRRMKQAGSERYAQLQSDYREFSKQ